MMQWVIGSIAHSGPTKLLLIPASAPQLVTLIVSKWEHLGMQCLKHLTFLWHSKLIGNKHQQQFLNELY